MKTSKEITKLTKEILDQYSSFELQGHISLTYLYHMLGELCNMEDSPKAHRYIGFIHGVMVDNDLCTIDDLRDICRPQDKTNEEFS